jgi:hypothetical protein
MANLNLLEKFDACEYPADFLVARLHGKKGGLFRNWEFLVASSNPVESLQDSPFYPYLRKYAAAGMWRFLRNEHLWVYKRMNRQLRENFSPYFAYHEISTLITCLRHLHGKCEDEIVLQQLHNSLLHSDIQKVLAGSQDFTNMLTALELCLSSISNIFLSLRVLYEKNGFCALESFLREKLFVYILLQNTSSMLKTFFQYIVDFHNCISLAKNIHWQIDQEPVFINGGTLEPEKFKRTYLRKDLGAVLKSFPIACPEVYVSSAAELETRLLSLITKELRRWSYRRTVAGDILFYLWEQFRYTKNISMVFHTLQLEDEQVGKSIIA